MITDKFGQQIYTLNDLCNLFYINPDKHYTNFLVDEPINFNNTLELTHVPKCMIYNQTTESLETFDQRNQSVWKLPKTYLEMDIAKYVLDKCKTDAELQRAGEELLLYQERNLFTLLKYLSYLVDTLREHKIVWGVGRGSSVASFVLYLLGVHKINSLYYDLSIEEFFK